MYVDATQEPWNVGYKMYSYVTAELPALLETMFPFIDTSKQSIFGHSMGGMCLLNSLVYKKIKNQKKK